MWAWAEGKRIGSVICNFKYQQIVRDDEEGVSAYSGKRLFQLNVLIPKLADALSEIQESFK